MFKKRASGIFKVIKQLRDSTIWSFYVEHFLGRKHRFWRRRRKRRNPARLLLNWIEISWGWFFVMEFCFQSVLLHTRTDIFLLELKEKKTAEFKEERKNIWVKLKLLKYISIYSKQGDFANWRPPRLKTLNGKDGQIYLNRSRFFFNSLIAISNKCCFKTIADMPTIAYV